MATKMACSTLERMDKAQELMEAEKPLQPAAKKAFAELKLLHASHIDLEDMYRKEWNQLKLKYFKKMEPLYKKRSAIIAPENAPLTDTGARETILPDFWLTVLKHHSTFAQTIEAHDEPILKYLLDIASEWKDPNEQLSFNITMTFAENPFFSNTVLTKSFELEDEPESEESVLTRTIGTPIQWKAGKNVMKKVVAKRQRNKNGKCAESGEYRLVKVEKDRESFFHFFNSHEIPDDEALEVMRDRDVQELENTLEVEYELGCILRDRIIPHAVGWYLDIEMDSEDDDIDDDEDAEVQEDSDDDDDSDEEVFDTAQQESATKQTAA